jgi:nucleoside-diphosphate-sugar epimerase
LTDARFGLDDADYRRLAETTDSVIHCAASLNRKSEKTCLNVNLRGTLEVIQLARRAAAGHGLRRFSEISTVAVCGERNREVVTEDTSIDWNRSDYDPYARTKKFCEHMVRELLPDVPRTVFRPSIVLGDSRRPETTQFDMVRAFVFLARLPVLPFRPDDRIDIVPVDYVADAVVALHQKPRPEHEIYHLSSGTGSETFRQLTDTLSRAAGKMSPLYWPGLEAPAGGIITRLARSRSGIGRGASLLKVFWPYLTWNTVFDNTRVVAEMGRAPARFRATAIHCFALALSTVSRILIAIGPGPGRPRRLRRRIRSGEVAAHDGFRSRNMGQRDHRARAHRLDARRGPALAAGRAAQAAFCRLQRHAQHRFGFARSRNSAPSAPGAGRRAA